MDIMTWILVGAVAALWILFGVLQWQRHKLQKSINESKRRVETLSFMIVLGRYLEAVLNDDPRGPKNTKQMAEDIAILLGEANNINIEENKNDDE